jgi:hypothetical protein
MVLINMTNAKRWFQSCWRAACQTFARNLMWLSLFKILQIIAQCTGWKTHHWAPTYPAMLCPALQNIGQMAWCLAPSDTERWSRPCEHPSESICCRDMGELIQRLIVECLKWNLNKPLKKLQETLTIIKYLMTTELQFAETLGRKFKCRLRDTWENVYVN